MSVARVFVYGTLRPGGRFHAAIAPFVVSSCAASVRGTVRQLAYPAARFDEDGRIDGVVLSLDPDRLDHALAVLDAIEDEGTLYRRVLVEADGEAAWAYEWMGSDA